MIAHDLGLSGAATAELYDPVTSAFSATGDQLVIFSGPQRANLLADGRVLLALCCGPDQLYDPVSGAFSSTGAMVGMCPDGFAMTTLPNGTVLVSGGYCEEANVAGAAAALYNPPTGTFNPTSQMLRGRYSHTATQLGDGTVLITAGMQGIAFGIFAGAGAELYDPATGTFSHTGDMTTGRFDHTATLLLDGAVLIAGGRGPDYTNILASAELYHPRVPVPAPVLFSGDGKGRGAIWHAAAGQVVSASNPAIAGEALSMYTTRLVDGGVIPSQVAIGERLAEIVYFGNAPGYPGYNQVNFRVPSGLASGLAVPVRLTYFSRLSNQVTIGVQ